ncbi:MAG TPA: hypothetical protein VNA04_14070, partial [Thermoanaerobaculia bacterium]|nr:hypothetical protein [Thermoanaerobaculia bacterium]
MRDPSCVAGGVGGKVALVAAFLVAAVALPAPAVLFPEPLHLVREIEDPISGTTVRIHEYCAGDRIVTVNGSLVVIADYGRQELTEVDRNAGTFSITSFADLARAGAAFAPRETAVSAAGEGRILAPARSPDGRHIER